MGRTEESPFFPQRLEELAQRAGRLAQACFSPFLSPPEADSAEIAARKAGVKLRLFGGYGDAERKMAGFSLKDVEEADFPISALELRWPHQAAPSHRDLLGSVMGLGLQRQCVGDIVLEEDRAHLFAVQTMARHIASSLGDAGRTRLQIALIEQLPKLAAPTGVSVRGSVPSLRLDAVVASGLNLSRSKAVALIEAGYVKLQHMLTLRPDARVGEGDMISVRGKGRVQVTEVGKLTRKERFPLLLTRFGMDKR